ncbi:hypothetical protein [Ancylomarina sp.]|uniref:hypothetical protein n=1 Tax=Ancylomarina sp. TaxID=1970196 RepID=UPI003569E23D
MSNQDDLSVITNEIQELPPDRIKPIETPVAIFLHEADSLHTRGSIDLQDLVAVGMPPNILDRIKIITSKLRTAQVNWEEQKTEKQKAKEIWKIESVNLYALRSELIEAMNFAYRDDERLMKKVRAIKKGRSHAKAIQDLAGLAVLGRANKEPLEAIHFDTSKCEKAADEASRIAHILGGYNGRMYVKDELLTLRDKCYSMLKEEIDELIAYGRFAYRKQPDKRTAYAHKYKRERNSKFYKNKISKQAE